MTDATVLTTREIEGLIPHRWPFLLVDRIVEYDPDDQEAVNYALRAERDAPSRWDE